MSNPGKKIRGARGFLPSLPFQQFSKTRKFLASPFPAFVYFAENAFRKTSAKGGFAESLALLIDNGLITSYCHYWKLLLQNATYPVILF
jgi:hypothetical protein